MAKNKQEQKKQIADMLTAGRKYLVDVIALGVATGTTDMSQRRDKLELAVIEHETKLLDMIEKLDGDQ